MIFCLLNKNSESFEHNWKGVKPMIGFSMRINNTINFSSSFNQKYSGTPLVVIPPKNALGAISDYS